MDAATQSKTEQVKKKSLQTKLEDWLDKKKNALMIVAILIATMGFQIGVNPPGGVWQDDNYLIDEHGRMVDSSGSYTKLYLDSQNKTVMRPHRAGYAVLASRDRDAYQLLYIFNTLGFGCSLTVIFLLVSGLPVRNKFFMWILVLILWVAISATAISYSMALSALTPTDCTLLDKAIAFSFFSWTGLTFLVLIGHVIRLFYKMVRKLWRGLVKLTSRSHNSAARSQQPV